MPAQSPTDPDEEDDIEIRVVETRKPQAVEAAKDFRPDWILFGLGQPPDLDALIDGVREAAPEARLAALGDADDLAGRQLWIQRGAFLYAEPRVSRERLRELMRFASAEHVVIFEPGPLLTIRSGDLARSRSAVRLTKRETEVLARVTAGHTNKEIASELSIALQTVEFHLRNILTKLDCRNRTEAATRSLELQLQAAALSRENLR